MVEVKEGKVNLEGKRVLKKIFKLVEALLIFILARFIALFLYDKEYLKCKYFKNKKFGIGAKGWKWILSDMWGRAFIHVNKDTKFPVSPRITVQHPENIIFHRDDLNNFQTHGSYFQGGKKAKIIIGKGTWIAPNVGIITTNHDSNNPKMHTEGKDVILGDECWIGMNSVILPGVVLGPRTTVGAGSVVTKSFEEGNCVIAGNPARKIRDLDN